LLEKRQLDQAARTTWESDLGCAGVCLVVTDDARRPIGMITDREIAMAAYTQGVPLRDARVQTAMARQVATCRPGTSLSDVETLT
jgi:CBS domain-containing protein